MTANIYKYIDTYSHTGTQSACAAYASSTPLMDHISLQYLQPTSLLLYIYISITMAFLSSIRTRYLAWSYSTPLPDLPDVPSPVFQNWYIFDQPTDKWVVVQPGPNPSRSHDLGVNSSSSTTTTSTSPNPLEPGNLRLLTWNIDAFGEKHEARIEGILSKLQIPADGNGPDVVFFQEVSPKALAYLLQHTWIRANWILSEVDETNWANVSFATMTLLSRSRFDSQAQSRATSSGPTGAGRGSHKPPFRSLSLGPVWRIKYPSRFNRDALCCDVFFWNGHHHATTTTRIRLINVHLDSLPIQPNRRPRQVAIAAELLRAAGRGLVAGDWNPVSEEGFVAGAGE